MIRASRLVATLVVAVALTATAVAQSSDLHRRIQSYVTANQSAIVAELTTLLAIPNTRTDTADLSRNAALLQGMLGRRGFSAEVVTTNGAPLVIGAMDVPNARGTLLLYAHYDGQPVDPSKWQQPTPFTPVLRAGRLEDGAREISGLASVTSFQPDWRIYARSASDDKAPIVALLAAIDALKSAGRAPTWNLRVLLDGEEESNSRSMAETLPRYRNKLAADLMLFLDGPLHPSGRPTVAFGARGLVGIQLTVYGPKMELHSGHYGNWVPNPAMRLITLLGSMKADNGDVLVKGFYDDLVPLTAEETAALRAVPDDADALMRTFGIARPEPNAESLQSALQRPSLNIRGFSSAFVGANTTNVIPALAQASLDIRLVQETKAQQMADRLRAHIVEQRFHVVTADPDDATRARYPDIVKVTVSGVTEAYRNSMSAPG
jgi:acetylornithine deacetylase/succinyl-diaminopimelate desuccinylase-like protein